MLGLLNANSWKQWNQHRRTHFRNCCCCYDLCQFIRWITISDSIIRHLGANRSNFMRHTLQLKLSFIIYISLSFTIAAPFPEWTFPAAPSLNVHQCCHPVSPIITPNISATVFYTCCTSPIVSFYLYFKNFFGFLLHHVSCLNVWISVWTDGTFWFGLWRQACYTSVCSDRKVMQSKWCHTPALHVCP